MTESLFLKSQQVLEELRRLLIVSTGPAGVAFTAGLGLLKLSGSVCVAAC